MEYISKKLIESLVIKFFAAFVVFETLQLFHIKMNAIIGIFIILIIACGVFHICKKWYSLKRRMDLTISSSTAKIVIGVVLAIVCWFFFGLSLNLIVENPANKNNMTPWGFTYMLISDPGTILESFNKEKDIPFWWLPFLCLISIVGFILFCGVMISVFSNIIQRRVDNYINGAVRYKHLKDHVVIIGFDEIMPSLVKQKCQDSPSDILILSKKNSADVREQVTSMLTEEEEKRIIIYCGRRDSIEELRNLNLTEAKEVYILGNRQNIGHDALNIDCLGKMKLIFRERREIEKEKNKKKACKLIPVTVMFDNYATFSAFQVSDLSKEWRKYFTFTPFNFYEYWAQKVIIDRNFDGIDKNENFKYPRIEGKTPLRGTDDTAHVVIFGITSMGVAIATQAALYLHFSKKRNGELRKSRISFICTKAKEEMAMFYSLYSSFFEIQSSYYRDFIKGDGSEEEIIPTYFKDESANFLDIEFEFINGKSYHPGVRDYLKSLLNDKTKRLSVFISTGNDRKDINIAMSLPDEIYTVECGRIVPIYVHQKASGELLRLLKTSLNSRFGHIYPFGMIDTILDFRSDNQYRAKLLNLYYSITKFSIEDVENEATKAWNSLRAAHQWSSIYCVNSFEIKLKEFGLPEWNRYNLEEIEKCINSNLSELCEIEQNRWNIEKLLMGFRKPHDDEQIIINNNRKKEFRAFKNKLIHDLIRPWKEISGDNKNEAEKEASKTNQNMIKSIPLIEKIILEKMKKNYNPNPINTSDIQLPEELSSLLEEMAKNVHEVWAKTRIEQGWHYGPERDDKKKLHPMLIPYEALPEEEKVYDRGTSIETLKLILKLGFNISKD